MKKDIPLHEIVTDSLPCPVRPRLQNATQLTPEKLIHLISSDTTLSISSQALLELIKHLYSHITTLEENRKTDLKIISSLSDRIKHLEKDEMQRPGRKRTIFSLNGRELDDEELLRLIDGEYLSIPQLEREVGAHKNQLRARYNRAKKMKYIEKGSAH